MKSFVYSLMTVVMVARARHNAEPAIIDLAIEYGSAKLGLIPEGGLKPPISVGRLVGDPSLMVWTIRLAGIRVLKTQRLKKRFLLKIREQSYENR